MAKIKPEKMYLVEERNQIMFSLVFRGFDYSDIAFILHIHRSAISRRMKEKHIEYKEFVFKHSKE